VGERKEEKGLLWSRLAKRGPGGGGRGLGYEEWGPLWKLM